MRDRRKGDCLLNAVSFIVSFVIFQLVFLTLRQRFKIKELEKEKERIERSNMIFENMYKNQINMLQLRIDELLKMKLRVNSNIPPDTIQAVKYAMKHAHPDNGGSTEEFTRFQKCYEELTRK